METEFSLPVRVILNRARNLSLQFAVIMPFVLKPLFHCFRFYGRESVCLCAADRQEYTVLVRLLLLLLLLFMTSTVGCLTVNILKWYIRQNFFFMCTGATVCFFFSFSASNHWSSEVFLFSFFYLIFLVVCITHCLTSKKQRKKEFIESISTSRVLNCVRCA